MRQRPPFILLDDARESSAENACLLENPSHVFVAFQGEEVAKTLEAASEAQNTHGGTLAGYISYEAGLALEPKLVSLADGRCRNKWSFNMARPFFLNETQIEPAKVSDWLSSQSMDRVRSAHGAAAFVRRLSKSIRTFKASDR